MLVGGETTRLRHLYLGAALMLCSFVSGCFAPLRSPAIDARTLPDEFRYPYRTAGPALNLANLTLEPPSDYLLGPGDVLQATIPGLFERSEVLPLTATVMANGEISLPMIGAVRMEGLNVVQAQELINKTYANGFLIEPRANLTILQKSTVSVLVLGQVGQPGVHVLPKYENDVGHALGAALGLNEDAADYIEVHHRRPPGAQQFHHMDAHSVLGMQRLPPLQGSNLVPRIVQIPLRGPATTQLNPDDIVLNQGDVVLVPNRKHEVFYVVGKLSNTNTVRFTVGNRERELGVGLVLPRDREIDVVTAVAMAGYIDPIDSPTTVTVHRMTQDGCPFLIRVDLIKARYDARETVLVQPGDIIYLNPDGNWWFRRTLDRVIGNLINTPYNYLFR